MWWIKPTFKEKKLYDRFPNPKLQEMIILYNNDPAQLAEKIKLAVNNYHDYSEMILNCNEKARNNFSVDKMVFELKNIYRNVR